ncbi:MAG: outer membrane lipoprotein carrier protein LolA [Thermodesulfovibrionia bacterium]|nr:outer membrane lipoprotein carrier protein LolA [Thermodesulfovibrionia bacterium]
MRKFQIFLMFFMSAVYCLLSIVSTSHASTVDEVVGRIQKTYGEIKDVQGRFSQTSHIKDLDRTERYEGEFFIKKPSSMRWNFSKPRDEEVIIRENDIWIYKKSDKQVLKSAFSKDAYSQVPIALLNNFGDLKNDFDIKLIKDDALELTPKRRMGFINKLLLEINSTDFPVKTFSVFDVYGNKIDITVKDVKINSGLEDSIFTFKLQPGVEIFDLNQ